MKMNFEIFYSKFDFANLGYLVGGEGCTGTFTRLNEYVKVKSGLLYSILPNPHPFLLYFRQERL